MKKIIIITLCLFILASCNDTLVENNKSKVTEDQIDTYMPTEAELNAYEYGEFELKENENEGKAGIQENSNNIQLGDIIEEDPLINSVEEIESEKEVVTVFSDLENNLRKLKSLDLDSNELEFLNLELLNALKREMEEKAVKSNNLSICDELDNNVNICKYFAAVKSNDINNCDKLWDESSIINCKNEINEIIAYKNLDESICNDILDDTEKKYLINSCINKVITKKALKNWDGNVCKQISNIEEQNFCKESVEMEKLGNIDL